MPDPEALDERLRAVERALTGEDRDLTDLRTGAERDADFEALSDRVEEAEARLDDLDAAVQALRGYVGNVRAVNETVERRADAALAKAESLEREGPTTDRSVCDCEQRRSGAVHDEERDSTATRDPDTGATPDPEEPAGLLDRVAERLR